MMKTLYLDMLESYAVTLDGLAVRVKQDGLSAGADY
jgi:hypothetical protein